MVPRSQKDLFESNLPCTLYNTACLFRGGGGKEQRDWGTKRARINVHAKRQPAWGGWKGEKEDRFKKNDYITGDYIQQENSHQWPFKCAAWSITVMLLYRTLFHKNTKGLMQKYMKNCHYCVRKHTQKIHLTISLLMHFSQSHLSVWLNSFTVNFAKLRLHFSAMSLQSSLPSFWYISLQALHWRHLKWGLILVSPPAAPSPSSLPSSSDPLFCLLTSQERYLYWPHIGL